MAVRVKFNIKNILDGTDLEKIEKHVMEQERLARRSETAQAKIKRQKQGGIFASNGDGSLPSAFVRKQRKRKASGLSGGRVEDSAHAKGTLSSEKIRPVDAEYSPVEQLMARLGVKKYQRKTAKGSLVSTAGRPINSFDNEFTKLRGKVNNIESTQKGLSKLMLKGQMLVGGASGLSSIGGIANLGLGAASKIPIVGVIVSAAVMAVTAWWEKYTSQYGMGGTRDITKKILASDVSRIGVQNENAIYSGENVFIPNPTQLQGLSGRSYSDDVQVGKARHILRHQGSYT